MSDRAIDFLGRMSARERWLLAILVAGVLPVALWLFWLAPLADSRRAALLALAEARSVAQWVDARATEKALLEPGRPQDVRAPIGASGLEQRLIAADLRDRLSSLSDRGDGQLELHFDEIGFGPLILWLAASDPLWGYDITRFRFERLPTPGLVAASLLLHPRS